MSRLIWPATQAKKSSRDGKRESTMKDIEQTPLQGPESEPISPRTGHKDTKTATKKRPEMSVSNFKVLYRHFGAQKEGPEAPKATQSRATGHQKGSPRGPKAAGGAENRRKENQKPCNIYNKMITSL